MHLKSSSALEVPPVLAEIYGLCTELYYQYRIIGYDLLCAFELATSQMIWYSTNSRVTVQLQPYM